MSELTAFFKMTLEKEPKVIVETNDAELVKIEFTISPISSKDDNLISISPPEDYPKLPEGAYITTKDSYILINKKRSVSTITRWCRENKIRAFKQRDRSWLIDRESLMEYINKIHD